MGVKSVQYNKLSFVVIENPGETEIKYLRRYYPFNPLNLEDYLTKTQRPKIEEYRHYVHAVLDFPYFKGSSEETNGITSLITAPVKGLKMLLTPTTIADDTSTPATPLPPRNVIEQIYLAEVSFFIGNEYVVILHEGNLPSINHLFERCQKTLAMRKKYMSSGSGFLFYSLLDALVDYCMPIMDKIASDLEKVDREILSSRKEEVVAHISRTRRNLVLFHTMVKPTIPLFANLREGKIERLNNELTQYWGNLFDHLQRIVDSLDDARELIEGLATSHESVLTFRTNEIVRFLTVLTAIAFPFVIINNLYSMNVVGLPFATQPWIVWALFGVIFLSGCLMILLFKLRNWL